MIRAKWKILLGLALVAVVAVAGIQYGFNGNAHATKGGPKFKEYVIGRGAFRVNVSATGVVTPIDRIEIKSKASGRIDELPIEEGDFITIGQLICRLDKTDAQADFDQARADLDIAEAERKQVNNNFKRRSKLYDKGLISREEFDDMDLSLARAKGKLVRARVALDQAQVRLDETEARAPIDGIILRKLVEAGQIISSGINNVSGGTAIAVIADMSRVYIEAGIDEIDVGKVHIGQTAVVTADAYPRREFSGTIIRMSPEAKVEQNVTQFNVIVEVENEDGRLKSGMNASMEITIVEIDNALLAPLMTLTSPGRERGGQGPGMGGRRRSMRTALVKVDGEFVEREVKIGMSDFKQAVVISGLEDGDTLGVPMTSRLKADNDRLEQRIKSSRSFGASSSSKSKSKKSGGK